MNKLVTKRELVKEIRQHLADLGIRKGVSMELNEVVSRQKVTCGNHVSNNVVIVKNVSHNRIFIEWYSNDERKNYSGEYPYTDVNVNYGIVMNTALILRQKKVA